MCGAIAGNSAGQLSKVGRPTAIVVAEAVQPDAALVDIRLPDGDGFDLAARLTQSYPWMAVLLTSSEFDHEFHARAGASGARGFVPKPAARADRVRVVLAPEDRE